MHAILKSDFLLYPNYFKVTLLGKKVKCSNYLTRILGLPAICVLSTSCAAFLKFRTGNEQANSTSTLTKLLSIVLKNEILKVSTFYQHKDYLAKSFVKKDFIHLFEIIYRVSKYCISVNEVLIVGSSMLLLFIFLRFFTIQKNFS